MYEVETRAKVEIERVEEISGLAIIRPKAFPDERGFFSESYNCEEWARVLDFHEVFKQVPYHAQPDQSSGSILF